MRRRSQPSLDQLTRPEEEVLMDLNQQRREEDLPVYPVVSLNISMSNVYQI
jgi:hypothetical protein